MTNSISRELELQAAREQVAALEKRLAEQSHKASARLAEMLDAVSDALFVVDTQLVIVQVNRAALRLLDHDDASALLGRSLRQVAPEPLLAQIAAGNAQRWRTEVELRTRIGNAVPVQLTVSRVTDANDRDEFVCTAVDLRERLRLERELHHAQRLESLGQLSAGIAHEIRNPLNYVIGNLDYLRDELPEVWLVERPELSVAIDQASEGASRMHEVVSDLLAFARTGNDRLESVNVTQILESTLRLATAQLHRRAQLVREYQSVPSVRAQRSRLGQVFLNLLMNAIQALPEDQQEQNRIHITTAMDEIGRVAIEVRDNGPGIPPEICQRIFDPFFTTKPQGVGSGLGLSICHGIVKRFGGEITLKTLVGQGTSFFIHLQVAD